MHWCTYHSHTQQFHRNFTRIFNIVVTLCRILEKNTGFFMWETFLLSKFNIRLIRKAWNSSRLPIKQASNSTLYTLAKHYRESRGTGFYLMAVCRFRDPVAHALWCKRYTPYSETFVMTHCLDTNKNIYCTKSYYRRSAPTIVFGTTATLLLKVQTNMQGYMCILPRFGALEMR
jgi:hypothetical protein